MRRARVIDRGTVKWTQAEAGWYTSVWGGICLEADRRWYFYPAIWPATRPPHGPYPSLNAALLAADTMEPS